MRKIDKIQLQKIIIKHNLDKSMLDYLWFELDECNYGYLENNCVYEYNNWGLYSFSKNDIKIEYDEEDKWFYLYHKNSGTLAHGYMSKYGDFLWKGNYLN